MLLVKVAALLADLGAHSGGPGVLSSELLQGFRAALSRGSSQLHPLPGFSPNDEPTGFLRKCLRVSDVQSREEVQAGPPASRGGSAQPRG